MTMRMIRITEEKKEKLGEHVEKILSTAGKLMQCVEALDDESEDDYEMGERRGYGGRIGMRGDYDDDMGYRDRWEAYGDRRGVRGTGRYSRYRR